MSVCSKQKIIKTQSLNSLSMRLQYDNRKLIFCYCHFLLFMERLKEVWQVPLHRFPLCIKHLSAYKCFWDRGGVLSTKLFNGKYDAKLEFQRGCRIKKEKPLCKQYGYLLKQHISVVFKNLDNGKLLSICYNNIDTV